MLFNINIYLHDFINKSISDEKLSNSDSIENKRPDKLLPILECECFEFNLPSKRSIEPLFIPTKFSK